MRGYVDSAEGQMHYAALGEGRPVVLLHQSPSSVAMWAAVQERLAPLGYRTVAFDLPGYGMSDPPPAPPDLSYYARRIADAATSVGLDRFDVIGHHTGCSVGLTLAVEHPDQVRRLVGYGVPLLGEEWATRLATEQPPVFDLEGDVVGKWWRSFAQLAGPERAVEIAARSTAEMLLPGPLLPYAHNAVGNADHDALLARLERPLLAIAGRHEMLHAESRRAAEVSPWVTFVELGDAGTYAADEEPDALVAAIDEFLRAPHDSLNPRQLEVRP